MRTIGPLESLTTRDAFMSDAEFTAEIAISQLLDEAAVNPQVGARQLSWARRQLNALTNAYRGFFNEP